MPKKHVSYELILFSKSGNMLCTGGSFQTKDAALSAVNVQLERIPGGAHWKVIKITRSIDAEGDGAIPHRSRTVRADQGRWW